MFSCFKAGKSGILRERKKESERVIKYIKIKKIKTIFFSITTMPLCYLESIPGLLSRVCSIYALKWVCQIAFWFFLIYLMDSCYLAAEHGYLLYSLSVLTAEVFVWYFDSEDSTSGDCDQNLGFFHFQWWEVTAEERMVKALQELKRMSTNKTSNFCHLKRFMAIPMDSQILWFS